MKTPGLSVTKIIQKSGIQRFILLPADEIAELLKDSHQQVVIAVGEAETRTSLVSAGKGTYKLFLNTAIRKAADVDSGEPIHLTLKRVEGSPDLPLPPLFKQALEQHPGALADFLTLSTGKRNEVIRFITSGKKEATQLSRIQKILDMLPKLT